MDCGDMIDQIYDWSLIDWMIDCGDMIDWLFSCGYMMD